MSVIVRPALRSWAVCSVLFAGTVLLFSRVTDYGFSNFDDPRYVTNNAQVQAGLTWDSVVWAFTARTDYWHPLTWLSHMLDWQLYGGVAGGHHLTSVGWHAVNAVLAFLVLRRLTRAFWTSAFGAALFAWHPQRVESVAWITERKDVMSGCFFLLTVWAYASYAERRRERRRAWGAYLLTLALFAGGLMCKPMLVTLPAVLLVLDFWPLHRFRPDSPTPSASPAAWRGLLLEKIPFFVLSAATSLVTVLMQRDNGAFTLTLPLDARLGNAVVSVGRYLGGFFWPFDLAVFYPHPGHWPAGTVLGAAILVGGLTAAAWRQRFARPWQLAGWGWFLVMLLPAIGLVQVGMQAMADRYTYLPIIGWQLALLLTLRELPVRPAARWISGVLAGVLLVGCAARTWDQQATWRDPVTLFEHAIAVTERNGIAEGFLGFTLLGMGRLEEAERHCQRALEIDPKNETALFTLAGIRDKQHRIGEAVAGYRTILQLNPNDTQTEYLLGDLLVRHDRAAEGTSHLKSAASQRPDLLAASLRIALAETLHGQPKNALPYYEAVIALTPQDAPAHFGFGLALLKLGRLEEAAAHFRAALASQPKFGLAHLALGRAAEQLGRAAEATASFGQAIALAPNNPVVHLAWAETLARRGRFAEAVPVYERAAQLQPKDAGVHAGLGYVLFLTNRRGEAVLQWEEALRLDPNFPGLEARLRKVREQGN